MTVRVDELDTRNTQCVLQVPHIIQQAFSEISPLLDEFQAFERRVQNRLGQCGGEDEPRRVGADIVECAVRSGDVPTDGADRLTEHTLDECRPALAQLLAQTSAGVSLDPDRVGLVQERNRTVPLRKIADRGDG